MLFDVWGRSTPKERAQDLIDVFSNGADDLREHAAYALTWNPEPDAEQVYIEFLSRGRDESHVRHAIKALGDIRSRKAVPSLTRIRDNPTGWHSHYVALVALRKINAQELPTETQGALDFLRRAKYSGDIDMQRLTASANIIRENLRTVLPDVFDLFLWVTKGNETTVTPNAKTILRDAGPLAFPTVRIGLKDPDENVNQRTRKLVEECGWEKQMKAELGSLAVEKIKQ